MLIGDDVAEFLRAWHGPSAREPVQASTAGPLALREWWAYENAWDTPLIRQNRVLRLSDIYQEAGPSVFYVENQAVWLWARGDGSDPAVYARENESGSQWERVGERPSKFLHHMAVFEAVLGGEFTLAANDVGGNVVRGGTEHARAEPVHRLVLAGPSIECARRRRVSRVHLRQRAPRE
jgi:hypothetical protein